MHALVVQSTLNDPEAAVTFAREQVVPRVSGASGLVAGYWLRLADDKGKLPGARDPRCRLAFPPGLAGVALVGVGLATP
jgi:hypothetical protein